MKSGEIYLTNFPRQDENKTDIRPSAVVLLDRMDKNSFYGIKLTTTFRSGKYNHTIKDYLDAGLTRPTYAVCNRIENLTASDIVQKNHNYVKIGNLSEKDFKTIYNLCYTYVKTLHDKMQVKEQVYDKDNDGLADHIDGEYNPPEYEYRVVTKKEIEVLQKDEIHFKTTELSNKTIAQFDKNLTSTVEKALSSQKNLIK